MKIKSIFVFIKLAENGCDFNVHKILGIPRSSMWTYISDLERTLGKKLVNRTKKRLSFTAAGEEFIQHAKNIYEAFEKSMTSSLSDPSIIEGDLYISTTMAIAHHWSMESVKDLYAQHSKLRLHINSSDNIAKDEETTYDILIRPFYDSDDFSKVWSIDYNHGLFASPDYIKKMGEPTKPDDLHSHRVLGYGEHTFSYFDDINWHIKGGYLGLPKIKPILTVNSTKAIFSAAEQGIGICSAPIESNAIYSGKLIRVLPEISGPQVKTFFCAKKSAIGAKHKNIQIFQKYFEDHLKNIGITITEHLNQNTLLIEEHEREAC